MGQSTAIGRGFERSKPALGLALAIAGAALAVDLLVLDPHSRYRFAVSLVAVAGLLLVARGDRATLGLVVRVEPRPGYWVKATLLAGLAVLCFAGLAAATWLALGLELDTRPVFTSTDQLRPYAWSAVVVAPLLEEPIYRLILCAPLCAAAGPRLTIVASGGLFAYLHFHYGNPGPDNFVAGYILGWAYLRSGSLVVPIALHALGNLCVFAANVGYFYYLN